MIKQVLFPALSRELGQFSTIKPGKHKKLSGSISLIKAIEMVDQNPIGKSSRSNPVTYVKAFDEIRDLFANTPTSNSTNLNLPISLSMWMAEDAITDRVKVKP